MPSGRKQKTLENARFEYGDQHLNLRLLRAEWKDNPYRIVATHVEGQGRREKVKRIAECYVAVADNEKDARRAFQDAYVQAEKDGWTKEELRRGGGRPLEIKALPKPILKRTPVPMRGER